MKTKPKLYSMTAAHRKRLKPWADKWIANAMSTKPMDDAERTKIRLAIRRLYEAVGLKPPPDSRIIFVPSPFVLRFAGGFAAWAWHRKSATDATREAVCEAVDAATREVTRDAATDDAVYAATREAVDAATREAAREATRDATYAATRDATYAATREVTRDAATRAATRDATREAVDEATRAATRDATYAATYAATRDATRDATYAATRDWFSVNITGVLAVAAKFGGRPALECATRAYSMWNGGNQWSGWVAYLSFFRHIAKLPIDYSKWDHYEVAAQAGPRIMHAEFCMVSERPVTLKVDDQNRPHCANGPFCAWRDGTALYAWHGVRVPKDWIMHPERLTPAIALTDPNIERRRAAAEIIGWKKVLDTIKAVSVDKDPDPKIGELLEVDLPDSPKCRFLKVLCGTGREFVLPVPREMRTALEANAWTWGLQPNEYLLEART